MNMMSVQKRYGRALLHTTALMAALFVHVPKALADPTGGTVTSGSAAITSSGATTTINQATDRAIIRWDTFDINANEHVQFIQPGASSITINRIRDNKPSNIQGRISANGNIVLINPNGMVFGSSAVVDVGGLVATTSDIEDDSVFMHGGAVKFTKPGLPDAKVINHGNMTVRDGGLVGLVAPNVENHGVIQARLGKVQLASGDIHTIDFAGDGLIKLEVSADVLSQSVTNTGTITADGGEILLTAAQARHMVDALVTNTGTLRADTVTQPDGTVKKGSVTLSTVGLDLSIPHNVNITPTVTIKPAQITNTGTISTSGNAMDQVGGDILILADHILIGDGSIVTATGDSGGGSIRIGGDYQGGNGVPTSDMIYVSEQAILNANSTRRGNGGRIILWSDTNTRFYGHAEAMGDEGGFIEISSKGFLDFNGTADLRGRNGVNGTLLLDPTNITISAAADSNVTAATPFAPNADTVVSVLNITTLQNALAGGNVIVQTRATGGHLGTITVDAAINWTSGSTLTLDAHNAITVNQAITANSGGLTMIAGADVVLNADISGTGLLTIRQNADTVTFGVAGGAGVLNLSVADLNRILDGWSGIVLGRDTATVAMTVNARTWTDNLTLQSGSGTITFAGATAVGANDMTIRTNGDISLPAGASWTGTGTLTLQQSSAGVALSMGGGAGTAINLTNTEAGRITNGWGNIIVGRTDATNTMTVGAVTWSDFVTFQSGTGLINITGVQTMTANTLTFLTDGDITLGAVNVLNGSSTVSFLQVSQGTTIGIGTGQAGTIQFTDAEVTGIRNGWTNVVFGRTDGTGDINVGALTWNDNLNLRTGTGAVNINGTQTMSTNALNITTVGGNIAAGSGAMGALTLASGGGSISTSGAIAAAATSITSGGGLITLGGTLGATTLAITTGNSNLTTTQAITATSTTNINSGTGFINFGAAVSSTAGAMTLTSAGNTITTLGLTSGALTVGSSNGNISIGSMTTSGIVNVTSGTGSISVTNASTSVANAMNLTSTGNTITTAGLTSGALTIGSSNGNISTGSLTVSGATNINAGSGSITIGGAVAAGTQLINLTSTASTITTAAMNSGALTINAGTGAINLTGAVSSGATAMNLTSTGNTITTLGLTSAALTVNSGGGNISLGSMTTSGIVNVNSGAGSISVTNTSTSVANAMTLTSTGSTVTTGALTSGALTINANGNILTGALTPSGIVNINAGSGGVNIGGTITAGTQAVNLTGSSGTITTGIINSGALTISAGNGNINLTGAVSSAATAMSLTSTGGSISTLGLTSGALTINSGNGNINTSGITASGITNINSGTGTINFGAAITSGAAAMTITTNNTAFTSNNTINAGALTIGTSGGNITINSTITATGATSLNSGAGLINVTTAITSGAGSMALTSSGNTITTLGLTSGALTINSNNGNISTGTLAPAGATIINSGTGSISIGAVTAGANTVSLTSSNNTISTAAIASGGLTVATGGGNFVPSGNLGSGAGAMNITTSGGNITTTGITTTTGAVTMNSGGGAITIGVAGWTSTSGAHSVNSGAGLLKIDGVISAGSTSLGLITDSDIQLNVANALTGTGTLTISQATDNVSMGIGDSQAGTLHISSAEQGRIANGWASLVFGRTDSTAALNVAALTWSDVTTFQSGSGLMTIAGATMGGNNLTLRTDSNVAITGNLTGSGTFALVQASANTSMGLGDGQAGTVSMDNAELSLLVNGWASLVFGRTDGTASFNLGARSWVDPLTIRSGSGQMNINGNQTMATNSMAIVTDSDIAINGNLTSTGTGGLTITGSTASTSIALGSAETGTIKIDDTEMGRIMNAWAAITIGSLTQTGAINVGTKTWVDPLTIRTGTGTITVNGTLSMVANNLAITSDSDIVINGALTGTGSVTISGSAAATTIGVGTGQVGTININDTELTKFTDGWTNIIFGTTSGTGAMNIGAATWTDNVFFRTAGGVMTVNGAQTMTGTNNLSFQSNANIAINAALTGAGSLTLAGSANSASLGVGTGAAGVNNINDTELAFITDGWSSLIFGSTAQDGNLTINARTWTDSVDFRTESGTIVFTGAQNVGANNLVIRSNVNFNLNQTMAGTGTITILGTSAGTTMGIGDTMVGTVNLTNAELANIADGWTNIVFGSTAMTGAMNVGAYTWNDNLILRSAPTAVGNTMSIAGATMGANSLTITTNYLNITGALSGTGDLTIESATAANTMGIGTGSGNNLNLTDTEVGFLSNGWNSITLGSLLTTGAMQVNALTWNDNLTLKSLTGLITVSGATMGANNLTMQTNSALTISGNISGTGTLSILQANNATTMGLAGGGGTLNLTNAELNFLVDGWSNLVFGRADSTVAVNVSARTWTDNVTIMGGTGTTTNVMTVAAQTMNANNLTLITNSNLAITGNLTGTGTLTIGVGSGTGGIGVGTGQAGTLNLTNAELGFFVDGWGRVLIGGEDNLGVTNIGAFTWVNPMSFVTQGDILVNGDQVSTEASGNSLVFATTTGKFINSAGSDALNPGGGRYLVYSVDALTDTLDGITPPTIVTNQSYSGYGPGSVVESGDVHIYSGVVAKILHLTIDDVDKIYGDTNPVFTYTYVSGLQNGDLLSNIIASYALSAAGSTVLDNAGTTRTIGGTFTLNNGYTYVLTTGTMTVIKADLTVEIDSDTREYGLANGTFSATYTGFKNGDDDTDINTLATLSTTATAASNVADYAITGTGASDNNYNFIYSNGTLEVTKATLVATSQNATREYGAADPAYTFNYTGFRNGDTAAVIDTGATGSSAAITANVGSYAITGSAAFDNNYTFTYTNSGTLTVTKATLTATTQNATREYGAADPALNVVYTGFRNGDTESVLDTAANVTTAATITSNVGSYGISASGAVDNNYSFSYVNTGNLSVTKAMLTATTQNATREYGLANPSLSVAYTGFRNGETSAVIDTLANVSTAATNTSNVGAYDITSSGASDGNYDFTYVDSGDLTITKAMLTATTQNATREYGAADPTFSAVYTGFRNGETSAVIDTLASITSTATGTSNVGAYDINASAASDGNYDFTYVNTGDLTITKAMLTATTQNATREYGAADPAFNIVYTGFRNGETQGVIDTLANITSTATITSNVGAYDINASGASDGNYDFTYANTGDLTITKATLTATTQNATRAYGAAEPTLNVIYTGFRNGDDETDLTTLANLTSGTSSTSNVGNYAISGSGAFDDNYQFSYANTGQLSITKAMLTATSQNATREYGAAAPTYTFVYTGFLNGETAAVIDTGATGSSAAITADTGTYGITGSGAVDNNYDFTYVNTGNLNITKAMLTVTMGNALREADEPDPTFTATYTGFRNGDTVSVLDTPPTFGTAATALSPLGDYAITASGGLDNNYNFTYVNGILSVVLDSTPPPPVLPTSVIPKTVEYSVTPTTPSSGATSIYDSLLQYHDAGTFNEKKHPGIVFIDDKFIFTGQNAGSYLIAISDQLRQEYYYFENEDGRNAPPQ